MKITRKQVIKALRTEPLSPSQWIACTNKRGSSARPLKRNCKVCAVGAVIRNNMVREFDDIASMAFFINSVMEREDFIAPMRMLDLTKTQIKREIKAKLDNGLYLGALSDFFESQFVFNRNLSGQQIRAATVKFVKENFPEEIYVERTA